MLAISLERTKMGKKIKQEFERCMRALANYDYYCYYYLDDCCCISTKTTAQSVRAICASPLANLNALRLHRKKTPHVFKFENKFLFNLNAKHSLGFNLFVDGCSLKSSLLLI